MRAARILGRGLLAPALALLLAAPAGAQQPTAPAGEIVLQAFDRLYMRANPGEPVEGTIIEETDSAYVFRRKGSESAIAVDKGLVLRVERAERPQMVYERRRKTLAPTDAAGHLALARFCEKHGLYLPAREEALLAARAEPARIEAYRLAVRAVRARYPEIATEFHAELRDRELEVYEMCERAGQMTPDLRLARARLWREEGVPAIALEELERVSGGAASSTSSTAEVEVQLEMGDLALGLGLSEQAAAAFEAAAAEDASSVRARIGLGLAHFASGRFEEARAAFDEAGTENAQLPEPRVLSGVASIFLGDLERALTAFDEAKALGDAGLERQLCLGLVKAIEGDAAGGAQLIDEALAVEETAEGLILRGFVHERAGEPDPALAAYQKAADGHPRLAGLAYRARADLLLRLGRLEEARQALEQAGRAGYDFGSVALALARVHRSLGQADVAVRFARYAEGVRPKDPGAAYETGLAYLRAGNLDEAEDAFQRALAMEPAHADAKAGLGRVAYGHGRFEEAAAIFRQVLTVDANHAYAKEGLKRIERAKARRVWRDDFERPDGAQVQNRWSEDERFGVDTGLLGGRLSFVGVQTNEANGLTRVTREVERERFSELSATLRVPEAADFAFGLFVRTSDGEVYAYRAPDGRLKLVHRQGNRPLSDPVELAPWPGGTPRALSIAVDGDKREEVVIALDGREVGRLRTRALERAGAIACGVQASAPLGARVDASVDEAKLYVLKPEAR